MVYVQNKEKKKGFTKKLSPNFKGPFKITKVNKNKTVEVQIKPNKNIIYHMNLLKPFVPGDSDEDEETAD